jgi:hypothetical protein
VFSADEVLLGEIEFAYLYGLRSGPARLEFTNRRFVAVQTLTPTGAQGMRGFKAWRASVPPGPVCHLPRVPYTGNPGPAIAEYSNDAVAEVRLNREVGLFVDSNITDLVIKGEDPLPLIFRIPAPRDVLADFVRQTPLGEVLFLPGI